MFSLDMALALRKDNFVSRNISLLSVFRVTTLKIG